MTSIYRTYGLGGTHVCMKQPDAANALVFVPCGKDDALPLMWALRSAIREYTHELVTCDDDEPMGKEEVMTDDGK